MGPHHRPIPQPVHTRRRNPLIVPYRWRSGALTCVLTRRILIQLAIFAVVAAIAALAVMVFGYMQVAGDVRRRAVHASPSSCPRPAGCIPRGNVTYRGTEVGRVESVQLTDTGVDAVLSLNSDVEIPADLDAEVHSVSAVGEQYVAAAAAQRRRADAEGR